MPPTGPDVGLTVSTGVIVNDVVAFPPAEATPVNVYLPIGAAGTVNVQENEPALLDVALLVVALHAVPRLQETETVEAAA